jgi:peptide/nickel transport system substrate-binding protein
MHRYYRFVTALLLAVTLVTACSQPGATTPGVQATTDTRPKVLIALTAYTAFAVLDPMLIGAATGGFDPSYIFDALVRYAPGNTTPDKIEPDLAEKWATSADGLQWTFSIRKGVQFQKGFGEVTAEDVKYSFDRQLLKGSGGVFVANYGGMKAIEVVDPYTIRFTLTQKDPFFLPLVANYAGGFIVSKAAAEKYGKDFRTNPVGSGPFQLKELRQDRLVMERNDGYWRGKPKLNGVEVVFLPDSASQLLSLKTGDVQLGRITGDVSGVTDLRKSGYTIDLVSPLVWTLHFNPVADPRFADIRVRQAFAYCTDRTAMAAFFGDIATPAYIPVVPEGAFGAVDVKILPDALKYGYDPERGKQLLAQAGFGGGFDITLENKDNSAFPTLGQVTQEQWKKCGVNMKIKVVDNATYDADRRKAILPILFDGGARAPIADIFIREWFYSKSATTLPTGLKNHAQYGLNGKGIDSLIDQARSLVGTNDAEAIKLYQQAQVQLLTDIPAFPLVRLPATLARAAPIDLGYKMVDSVTYSHQVTELTDIKR